MMEEIIHLSEFEIDNRYLAHPPDETLIEHSDLTIEYLENILKSKNINEIIDRLTDDIDLDYAYLVKKMFINAIYLHDIGKTNPYFQAKKMNNKLFDKYKNSSKSSNHSDLSATKYINYFLKEIDSLGLKRIKKYKLHYILYSFAYQISKHHGFLNKFWNYRSEDKVIQSYQHYIEKLELNFFNIFILNKLLFSLLISSDYYATTDYLAGLKINDFGIFDDKLLKVFDENLKSFIKSFPEPKGINILRKEIFEKTQAMLLKNLHRNIYYLEAPTGSGKTITSINLTLNILKNDKQINKIFYIFPYNTLVEQTKKVFDKILQNKIDISIINSITPISNVNQEQDETEYTKSYIERLFFNSPIILTTHVSFFNILFGVTKNDNYPLWQLANSVIILDEIQSYKNELWWYMVEFFDKYAEVLNIKMIIMSATLPKLDYFLEKKDNFVNLLSTEDVKKIYSNPFFKNRVLIDFSLLENGKINLNELRAFFIKYKCNFKKILFEFIKKQTAREFYNMLKEEFDNVYELTGDDNKAYRNFIIEKTKKDESIIIIATQVVEAGVDIDMDLGFKDISTIDSEEQFMGRINRNAKKDNAKVYFFDIDDESTVYRGNFRLEFSIKNQEYRKFLKNKNYHDYYNELLKRIKEKGLKLEKGFNTNMEYFLENLKKLNYGEINKQMELINSFTFTLYFPFKIDVTLYQDIPEFYNINEEFLTDFKYLDGKKVWEYFLHLILSNMIIKVALL